MMRLLYFMSDFVVRRSLITYAFLLVSFLTVNGQQVKIQIEPSEIMIGKPAVMTIEVEVPANGIMVWPDVTEATDQRVEILRFGVPDTIKKEGNTISLRQVHTITAWREDFIPIPPLEFVQIAHDDTLRFSSRAMLFQVKGVDVDMEAHYKDIRPIFSIPVTPREVIPYVLIALAIGAVLFLIIYYLRKRENKQEKPTIWEKPDVPAHIAAISSLEVLKGKRLWQQGKTKAYHIELTDILRKYLYKRFQIDATEMTSREIMEKLPIHIEDHTLIDSFKSIIELADLVKFARFQPLPDENSLVMNKSIDFIKGTIPTENITK